MSKPSKPAPQIGFLLQRAHNVLRARLTAELAGTGLHLGHVAILGTTWRTPGLSQRTLSALTGIEKSSVVIFIDTLEREGWMRRGPHPSDRRTRSLYVTAEGLALLGRIGPRLQEVENRMIAVLSDAERDALADSLAKLAPLPDQA